MGSIPISSGWRSMLFVAALAAVLLPRDAYCASSSSSTFQCNIELVNELEGCCGDREAFISFGNLTGTLPANFSFAKRYTDLSNNPGLCGEIYHLPQALLASTIPPFNLSNTQVKLNLPALSRQDPQFGVKLAYWLAEGVLSSNNLHGMMAAGQAYHVCTMLGHGRAEVVNTIYCNGESGCPCGAWAQTSSVFPDKASWDACHVTVFELRLPNITVQKKALAEYNKHMNSADSGSMLPDAAGFACAEDGKWFRVRVVFITVGSTIAAVAVFGLLGWLLYSTCFAKQLEACIPELPDMLATYMKGLLYIGLHIYDMISDWLYVFAAAESGNMPALLTLGWVLTAPYIIALLPAVVFTWLNVADEDIKYLLGEIRDGFYNDGEPATLLLLVCLTLAYVLTSLTMLGMATTNMIRFLGNGTTISVGDTMFHAKLFLGFAIVSQAILLLAGGYLKGKADDEQTYVQDEDAIAKSRLLTVVYADLPFVILEDLPQAVLQCVLWVRGDAMVATATYVTSAVASILSMCLTAGFVIHYWQDFRRRQQQEAESVGHDTVIVPEPEPLIEPDTKTEAETEPQPQSGPEPGFEREPKSRLGD